MELETPSSLTTKARGAFFTPRPIADFITAWTTRDRPDASVLDPTCGEAVFLLSAAERLRDLGATSEEIARQVTGVDVHGPSLVEARALLHDRGLKAALLERDFFELPTPAQLGSEVPWQDAVIGNPPFVRYQDYRPDLRKRAAAAALSQGVRMSGLASSWAPLLVHSAGFLKPNGRLAMVLPAELLTVQYAEPVRRWLRKRFAAVNLVLFEELQFADAEEQVVLLLAQGSGGCDSLSLLHARGADDLARLHPCDGFGAAPAAEGKWTDLMLPAETRRLFRDVATQQFTRLDAYGTPELGTVTGANAFFALSEATRLKYNLNEEALVRISPPGTRHLKGATFSRAQWEELRLAGERVWLLCPDPADRSKGLRGYIEHGDQLGVPHAYKCTVRTPWWRPPAVPTPDIFFTYMSHRFPRLIANTSGATILNSMHGIRLHPDLRRDGREALPLLAFNSATMLGAEVLGRSYGGGILKMEPREAAGLPVPNLDDLRQAWDKLRARHTDMDAALRRGEWPSVVAEVDEALLSGVLGLDAAQIVTLRSAATMLRVRRTRQTEAHAAHT